MTNYPPTHSGRPVSQITPPEKVFYDFNQAIETIIKFIDMDLNDKKVAEHIKQDLRVLRAIVAALNANYPFTQDPNDADAKNRAINRLHALDKIFNEFADIQLGAVTGRYDSTRSSN